MVHLFICLHGQFNMSSKMCKFATVWLNQWAIEAETFVFSCTSCLTLSFAHTFFCIRSATVQQHSTNILAASNYSSLTWSHHVIFIATFKQSRVLQGSAFVTCLVHVHVVLLWKVLFMWLWSMLLMVTCVSFCNNAEQLMVMVCSFSHHSATKIFFRLHSKLHVALNTCHHRW